MTSPQIEFSSRARLVADPLVSVVMLTYNHERYLAEAIESVIFQQTSFPVELLIGEDCSTDGTKEIALGYQKRFPEVIRIITSEKNVGGPRNHARLIAAARGKYIAFCEGDDFWHRPDKLACQVAVLESDPNISFLSTGVRMVSENGVVINPDMLGLEKGRIHELGIDEILLKPIVWTVTVCARAESMKHAMCNSPFCIPGRYLFADVPLCIALSQYGACCCLPEVFASYRLSTNSATRPRDLMDSYRFMVSGSQFVSDVLELHSLPQGEAATLQAKIEAARLRLLAFSRMGESTRAKMELAKLRELGAKVNMKDRLRYLLSTLVHPGTFGAAALKWGIPRWRQLKRGNRLKRSDGNAGQMMNHRHETRQSPEFMIPDELSFIAPIVVDDLIRVGGPHDGGYVLPKSVIAETEFLVSLGINDDWSFDEQFRRLNSDIPIHAYNYSISKKVLMKRTVETALRACIGKAPVGEVRRGFRAVQSYGSFFQGSARHFKERVFNRAEGSLDVTLNTVLGRTKSDRVFLKIDIEGDEYRLIDPILEASGRIVGMAIEFHNTDPLRMVFVSSVRRLQEHFEIVHLHANNFQGVAADGVPEALEITFVRKSARRSSERRTSLPIPEVDSSNNPATRDYRLRFAPASQMTAGGQDRNPATKGA